MSIPNYTRHPGRQMVLNWFEETEPCQLFMLDARETTILRRVMEVVPKYYWVWQLDGPQESWGIDQINLWDDIQSVVETLEAKLIMGCDSNALIEAINGIALSVGSSSGNCGCAIPDDDVIDAAPAPPGDPFTETPPEGFSGTWEEYLIHKCKASNKIIDDLVATLRGFSTIPGLVFGMSAGLAYLVVAAAFTGTGSSLVASGLLGVMALGLSAPATVAIVLSALVALFLLGGAGLGYLVTLADSIEDNKADVLCDLYNSQDVEEARSVLAAFIDDQYDVGWSEGLRDILDKVTLTLFANATLNVLFEDNDEVAAYTGGDSCDSCAGCDNTTWFVSEGERLNETDILSGQNQGNGWQYVSVYIGHNGAGFCSGPHTVNSIAVLSNTTAPDGAGDVVYRYYNQAGSLLGTWYNTPPVNMTSVGRVLVHVPSTTNPHFYAGSFTIRMVLS